MTVDGRTRRGGEGGTYEDETGRRQSCGVRPAAGVDGARPESIDFVQSLPKTRSGKIMRRVLRARALGLPEGDLSTLEE